MISDKLKDEQVTKASDQFVKSEKHLALEARVRETPLIERLELCSAMIGKMCKEGRPPKMTIPVQYSDEDFFINTTLHDAAEAISKPIPMILNCPNCGMQHVDESKPDVCERCGKSQADCSCSKFTAWLNPPHKSHRCGACNTVWRPADVATVGVERISTRGEGDTWQPTNSARSQVITGGK